MARGKYTYGFCQDCGNRQRVSHREWIRASRPRCQACGGSLQKSEAAQINDINHKEALKETNIRRGFTS